MKATITKSQLRKMILQYRRLLSDAEFERRNQCLLTNIDQYVREQDAKVIHTFLPMKRNREPDVTPLFRNWWVEGRKIVVSKTNFVTREMEHFYLAPDTILATNKMGIPEPVNAIKVDFFKVELILVPLLLADRNKNRIGYGGGFYDQLLEGKSLKKAGISLAPLCDEIIQSDEWDMPLDEILHFFEKTTTQQTRDYK